MMSKNNLEIKKMIKLNLKDRQQISFKEIYQEVNKSSNLPIRNYT